MTDIIRTLFVGSISSLACNAAVMAYALEPADPFLEEHYDEEVADYVRNISGVALASGIIGYDKTKQQSYQVLAQVLNSANTTKLPQDLKNSIGALIAYAPTPYAAVQPYLTTFQIKKMEQMADHIDRLMRVKYGVNLQNYLLQMQHKLLPQVPAIMRSCGINSERLPTGTLFRPRLGRALKEAYDKLTAKEEKKAPLRRQMQGA